ncbi:hypothetical protein B0H10DRAFT_2238133 [Mycena sp. CBHHK59/15]|nr:hypothetical protein B0H10DRAFT_2238133 [Mycena sp. CBHHK59/15]
MEPVWTDEHTKCFVNLRLLEPVLRAPRYVEVKKRPFIVTTDGSKDVLPLASPSDRPHTPMKRSASGKTPKTAAAKPARIVHLRATASTTIRNLCLKSYIQKNGKVTKEVFDFYFKGLSPEELKEWETPNEAAGTSGNAGRRKLYREYSEQTEKERA